MIGKGTCLITKVVFDKNVCKLNDEQRFGFLVNELILL